MTRSMLPRLIGSICTLELIVHVAFFRRVLSASSPVPVFSIQLVWDIVLDLVPSVTASADSWITVWFLVNDSLVLPNCIPFPVYYTKVGSVWWAISRRELCLRWPEAFRPMLCSLTSNAFFIRVPGEVLCSPLLFVILSQELMSRFFSVSSVVPSRGTLLETYYEPQIGVSIHLTSDYHFNSPRHELPHDLTVDIFHPTAEKS